MADDQNIDVNINTVVDRESLDQLKEDLSTLQDESIAPEVDTSGLDNLDESADGANEQVEELDESLDGVDGGGAQEAANDINQVGSSSSNAVSSVTDLTNVLGLIGGAIAVGGVVAGIDSIVSSAASVNDQMDAMRINFNLDPSGIAVASTDMNNLNSETGVAKGSIRGLDNAMGMAGVTNVKLADGVIQTAAQLSYLKTGSNDATESLSSMFTKSITSGKMAEKAYASNGVSLDQMAERAGMTKDEMVSLFESMTPDERASFLSQYAIDTDKAKEANEGLKESYDVLKDKFDQKIAGLGTAFGQMVLPFLIPAISIATGALTSLAGVITGLPDWAKTAIGAGILAVALLSIGVVLWTTVIPAASAALIGFLNMIPSLLGVAGAAVPTTAGMAGVSAAFWSAAAAIWAAIAPLLPFIAAALAIAAVVYLVGQYFGWWKDIPTMIQAIQAGVMRLWDAFINSSQVQAVIEWLKAAWQGVLDFLQPVFDFITSLWNNIFPPQEGGFDIVQQIINLFGWLGSSIAMVVGWIQANWPLVSIALMPVLAPLYLIISVFNLLKSGFGTVVSYINNGASQINGFINSIRDAWNSFTSGFMSAYNTYVKPAVDALQGAAKAASDAWNSINNGGAPSSGGPSAGGYAAGGADLSTIQYPEQNHYTININGLVTEQSQIDYLLDLIGKGDDQENMRT
ncbi:MAG: hypothetical protein NKF70_00055 [Methanobacterium sp. ERen5]|nr:MAG: hypothetical protein NKF70_00055 [Methanobacterium sp. ERen5]